MKKILTLALFLPLISLAQTEQFYVTFLKGIVTLQRTKQPLKIGEKLTATDKLIFKDKSCKVACISPGKGRFEIIAEQTKTNEEGELMAVLKASLLPSSNTYHLSTRSLLFEGYDPKTYFNSEETHHQILLLTDKALPISATYKNEPGNFFFIQYKSSGKIITKKIERTDQGIVFDDKLFSGNSDVQIPESIMLCYQSKESGISKSAVLAEFHPIFASSEAIKEQINIVKKYAGISDPKNLNIQIVNHIYENYGKIGQEEISLLMGNN